ATFVLDSGARNGDSPMRLARPPWQRALDPGRLADWLHWGGWAAAARERSSAEGGAVLLDDFMPQSDGGTSHSVRIGAAPERVYACLWTADFDHWGITRALYALRVLPVVAAAPHESWRRVRVALRRRHRTLDDMLAGGFTMLAECPGEELVLGTMGRFWR